MAPAQASQQKSAPPPRNAPREAPAPMAAPDRSQMNPMPQLAARPGKPDGLDKSDKSMQKLIAAATKGDVAAVQACLDEGIDPDGPAKDGSTPLMKATAGGHLPVIEALLAAFADPTLGKGSETPMTIAFEKGKQDILKVLFAATFNSLDSMTNSGAIPQYGDGMGVNSEVPDNAMYEYKEITTQLAKINRERERPESPAGHKKFGNYAGQATGDGEHEKDSDMVREEGVRLMMQSLVKTTKAGGIGEVVPKSP